MPPPRRLTKPGQTKGLPGRGKKPTAAGKKKACCEDPNIQEEDGSKICKNCFTLVSETNIVSDVTFEETANGAAAVQGGFIGENSRHASGMNTSAFRRMGGGERNNIADIERRGKDQLSVFRRPLQLDENHMTQAQTIWGLAARNNLTAGRTTEEVVAACLYAACRKREQNKVLLIDIAELIRINVFRLGEVYKMVCKELFLRAEHVTYSHMVALEPLIEKYCNKLEFGDATRQVAEDALKIMRRMRRDWMTDGRHPAGLCGACIILAARMNNFKRTVREVVFVAKVADVTIAKRIEEFRRTKSAGLTVTQFRDYAGRIRHEHDPPAIHNSEQNKKKFEEKKRKRQEANHARDSQDAPITIADGSNPNVVSENNTPQPEPDEDEGRRKRARLDNGSTSTSTQQTQRFDSDGFAIPSLPASAAGGQDVPDPAEAVPKKRGRKRFVPLPIDLSQEELLVESELQTEIEEALDNEEVVQYRDEVEASKGQARAESLSERQRRLQAETTQARRDAAGVVLHNSAVYNSLEIVTAADLEIEFADDPEVENCILSGQAAIDKEKIWLQENEDWLRSQHEKKLIKEIQKANGKEKKTKGRKRKGKRDGPLLTAAGTPAETPADAAAAALANNAGQGFSKYVNYEALQRVYGSQSRSVSRAGSQAPSGSQDGSPPVDGSPPAVLGASRSPTAAGGLSTPAATQQQTTAPMQASPEPSEAASPTVMSPPPTQIPAAAAAPSAQQEVQEEAIEEVDGVDEDVEDEVDEEDESGYQPRYPGAYGEDDDEYGDTGYEGEGYGEDDYDDAIDPMGNPSIGGTY